MNPIEIVALIGLSAYSLYKQSHRRELVSSKRFLLPAGYVVVGLAVGGFVLPQSALAGVLLALGWLITLVTGFIRGIKTRIWIEKDGTPWAQGTTLTITLFIAMIAAKLGLGTIAYLEHLNPAGGFGEIIASIGVMMLFQSEIVHRRALRLPKPTPAPAIARSRQDRTLPVDNSASHQALQVATDQGPRDRAMLRTCGWPSTTIRAASGRRAGRCDCQAGLSRRRVQTAVSSSSDVVWVCCTSR